MIAHGVRTKRCIVHHIATCHIDAKIPPPPDMDVDIRWIGYVGYKVWGIRVALGTQAPESSDSIRVFLFQLPVKNLPRKKSSTECVLVYRYIQIPKWAMVVADLSLPDLPEDTSARSYRI